MSSSKQTTYQQQNVTTTKWPPERRLQRASKMNEHRFQKLKLNLPAHLFCASSKLARTRRKRPNRISMDNIEELQNCPQQTATSETMSSLIYKRKKRKQNHLSPSSLLIGALICVSLVELFCDICRENVKFVTAATTITFNGEQQQDNATKRERFVDGHPMDAVAVIGQWAHLACLVENKRSDLSWFKNDRGIGIENYWHQLPDRYSLVPQVGSTPPLPTGEPGALATSGPASDSGDGNLVVSNYTLLIRNVSLTDDANFSCALNSIKSRTAKLTVWQPPSRLYLSVKTSGLTNEVSPLGDSPSSADGDLITLLESDSGRHQHEADLGQNLAQGYSAGEQSNRAEANSETSNIERIIVKQGSRLRLECRSDAAKPHAQLVWLDGQQRKVAKDGERGAALNPDDLGADLASENATNSHVSELVEADPTEPKLASSRLIWWFQVNQRHADQVLSCLAQHPAFEHKQLAGEYFGKQLLKQVQLDVHYPPEKIEIVKEPSQALENRPIKFQCYARARPNQLAYRWFIDNQLVANATEPELRIERLSRQMHLRELRCEVTNPVGTESATLRLAVHYAPAFVTHLLPASLQPPLPSPEPFLTSQQQAASGKVVKHTQGARSLKMPSSGELALARQLAIGFEKGDDVQLRCDFDSNPRVKQVLWFKMNTEYDIMTNVTPIEADELIESGAAHAIFRESDSEVDFEEHNRRKVQPPERSQLGAVEPLEQLDYEQMSSELLAELALYDADRMAHSLASSADLTRAQQQQQVVEQIQSPTPSSTSAKINEPLGWSVARWPSQQARQLAPTGAGALPLGAEPTGRRSLITVSLIKQPGQATGPLLMKREVSLSSSFMLIKAAKEEAMGKYVCKSKPADGYPAMARAVYLVQRKEPRVISHSKQWAPSGARHIQVECLAEVRAVIDNMTSISWTKNGQHIHEMASSSSNSNSITSEQNGKRIGTNISIKLERSPDFLYVRSVLRIEGDELDDYFGQYNCTITNSRGSDHLIVDLQKLKSTGFVFAAMASMAISAVLLLICVVGLLIVCTPRRKLESKGELMSPATKLASSPPGAMEPGKPNGSVSSSLSDRKSPRSLDSQDGMLAAPQPRGAHSVDSQQAETLSMGANYRLVNQSAPNQQLLQQPIERSGSAFEPNSRDPNASDTNNNLSEYRHKLRCSLRQPMHLAGAQQHQYRSGRFAAISESLEHKLQRGPQQVFSPRAPPGDQQHRTGQDKQDAQGASSEDQYSHRNQQHQHQVAVSELERSSLINRLWTRLLMKPERAPIVSTGRRIKSRPVISMPVHVNHSSASNSLSKLNLNTNGAIQTDTNLASTNNNTNNVKINSLNHINGGHLVSSKANLIQDSTTASDGTASSGRSSSSSANGNHHSQGRHEAGIANNHANLITAAPLNYPTSASYMQPALWMQTAPAGVDAHQLSQSPKIILADQALNNLLANPSGGGVPLDCGLYVNETGNSYNSQAPEQSHLFGNALGYLPQTGNPYSQPSVQKGDHTGQMINGYPTQTLAWNDTHHNRSATPLGLNHHCQMPMLSESHFGAQQQPARPAYYATVNSKQVAANQQQQFNHTAGNYGTLPVRLAPSQMVATSDAGDAYFDTNYGTLISRSSVYKTLGYAASNTSSTTQQNCHSPSSSPNSLTTHTNNTMSSSNQDNGAQHLPPLQLSSALLNGDIMFGDSQVAVVQSGGNTISATSTSIANGKSNLNDKSFATNV